MATLRNKMKLADLNKENCEQLPRSNLVQNSNVPRSQEDYKTQVSEEIEGGVTKTLSQEFSRTKIQILGALARLDDFLMNPLIQGHSGAAPEASRNAFGTSRGTKEDDSQSDLHPKTGIFIDKTTQNSGPEDRHDMVTELQNRFATATTVSQKFTKKSLTAPLGHHRESSRRTALPINCNSAVKTPLRRLKQTNFCWPFSSWHITTILQFSITTWTKFPECQSHSRQRCPRSTGNLKNSSCLKIFSKRASKSIMSWLKKTESTSSILSWGKTHYKHFKKSMALPERMWEKSWQFFEGNT